MAKLNDSELEETSKQLSIRDVLDDYLVCQENLAEWTARKDRDVSLMEHKMRTKEHKEVSEDIKEHKESNLKLKQLTLNLGDYNIVSAERVRSSFNKNYLVQQVALKLFNARRQKELASDDEELQSLSKEELIARIKDEKLATLEEISTVVTEAKTYTKHWNTEPKYTGE